MAKSMLDTPAVLPELQTYCFLAISNKNRIIHLAIITGSMPVQSFDGLLQYSTTVFEHTEDVARADSP